LAEVFGLAPSLATRIREFSAPKQQKSARAA
jgi:hypothetical protein